MNIKHKTFLLWLLYAVVILISAAALVFMGLPQTALAMDHSHLTLVLLVLYLAAEFLGLRSVLSVSRELRIAADFAAVVKAHKIDEIRIDQTGVFVLAGDRSVAIEPSILRDHIVALHRMGQGGRSIDQTTLLQALVDERFARTSGPAFLASRIVWVGILATIVGVVMAFWPFMAAGMNMGLIATKLGSFFAGIAVAFMPTAVSFVFKIVLDVLSRIIDQGNEELVTTITRVCETDVIPYLERT